MRPGVEWPRGAFSSPGQRPSRSGLYVPAEQRLPALNQKRQHRLAAAGLLTELLAGSGRSER
jgi:hypothetical protein